MNTPETPESTTDECEVLADGRVAHFMVVRLDGTFGCVRCPAIAGKHGLIQRVQQVPA